MCRRGAKYSKLASDDKPMSKTVNSYLDEVKWTSDGLVAAIAQDHLSGKILMMAWMNREALSATVEEGFAVYWSRSRQKLWRKGESSGHRQVVKSIYLDCDADALVLKIEQRGGIAFHTGRQSCFFREFNNGQWQSVENVLKDPKEIYS